MIKDVCMFWSGRERCIRDSLACISSRIVKAAADKRPRLHRDESGEFAMPVHAAEG